MLAATECYSVDFMCGNFVALMLCSHFTSLQASQTEVSPPQKEEEEEVDIDLTDPDVENAAIKIQAGFKGYKTRKEVQEKKVGRILISVLM